MNLYLKFQCDPADPSEYPLLPPDPRCACFAMVHLYFWNTAEIVKKMLETLAARCVNLLSNKKTEAKVMSYLNMRIVFIALVPLFVAPLFALSQSDYVSISRTTI
jgi:hypothetical protein